MTIKSNISFSFGMQVASHVTLRQSLGYLQGSPCFDPAGGLPVGYPLCQCKSCPLLSMDNLLELLLSTGRLSEFQLSTDRLLSNLPSTDGLLIRLLTSSGNMGLAPYQCILFLPSIDGLSLNLPFMNGLSLYLPYLNGLILCLPCVNGPMYSQPCFDGLDQCSVSQASVLGWTLLSSFASGRYGTSHLVVNIISLVPAFVQLYVLVHMIKLFCLRSSMLCHDFQALLSALRRSVYCFARAEDSRPFWGFKPIGLVQSLFKWFLGHTVTHVLSLCKPPVGELHANTKGGGEDRRDSIYFIGSELVPCILQHSFNDLALVDTARFEFQEHVPLAVACTSTESGLLFAQVPLDVLIPRLPNTLARELIRSFGLFVSQRSSSDELLACAKQLALASCSSQSPVSMFRLVSNSGKQKQDKSHGPGKEASKQPGGFPPTPPSSKLRDKIIHCFCADTNAESLEEQGCAVCGQLILGSSVATFLNKLSPQLLSCLESEGTDVTRLERFHNTETVRHLSGPVLASNSQAVCNLCWTSVRKGRRPKFALANRMWYGDVPCVLKNLFYIEKLLISHIQHNRCIVKVLSSGSRKMVANAISFRHPSQKIYATLPPSPVDLDDVIAIIFTGPAPPTDDDFKRMPMLVRRKKVYEALSWLKLNHRDYADLQISLDNLMAYPENMPPVVIDYRKSTGERPIESCSLDDSGMDDGTINGICPLTVHGITGQNYTELPMHALKALAIQHLQQGGRIMAIDRDMNPETLWNNVQLYPMIFPWLFPYGLGGIGLKDHKNKISDIVRKRNMLMYYDKCFQLDENFSLIAFNHEQIKDATSGGFLLTKRSSFNTITDRLFNSSSATLSTIADRMRSGETVIPKNEDEKQCSQLLRDLDIIGKEVQGSLTSK